MDPMPSLRAALLDLLFQTRDADLRLIIGGGYGIYLKREHVRQNGLRTLLRQWPEVRSTNDLDLFLRPELLIDSAQLKPLAEVLRLSGYATVPGAEKYQFARPGPGGGREGSIKIDLLTGPQHRFAKSSARVDERRVRPQPSVDLHAHPVNEALTLEDELLAIEVAGKTSDGQWVKSEVHLPHPLTYAMMKLFAFRDRVNDEDKAFGQYHALDLYAIVAMTTEAEWERTHTLRERHRSDPVTLEATRIATQYFSSSSSEGMIRMRESPYCRPDLEFDGFCEALREFFPAVLQRKAF